MTKAEFESIIGEEISMETYQNSDNIRKWYPGIKDANELATLYGIGGNALLKDMLPRAMKLMDLDYKMTSIKAEIESLKS